MRLFIQANEDQRSELGLVMVEHPNLTCSDFMPNAEQYEMYEAFFILDKNQAEIDYACFEGKAVFINEVILTLSDLNTVDNIYRINAWPTFLKRDTWEVAGKSNPIISEIFEELGKKPIFVKDLPGMVAARVISMIINEAFYALNENVSTKEEIDLAMKLGTNYPYGPFEWAGKICLDHIYNLLLKLSQTDERCIPAFKP
ncbi:MAG: 3-hydroxyacyl-CoA dehydrogenase family protein [Ginsengibacter sp.]